jgi:predicted AAA+ superfamily ATPase
MGRLYPNSDTYGKLLHDLVALYLYKMSNINSYFNILHDSGKKGSDFVVKDTRDNTNIVIEVGYGLNKNGDQVYNTINKFKARYGIVISKKDLKIEGNIVFIPHKLFFLL